MDSVVGVFGGVAIVAAIGWMFWAFAYNFRLGWVAKKQAEVQFRLLERLGTGTEVLAYLQSPQGQHLLDAIGVERGSSILARIMGSVQAGLILVLFGASLLVLRVFVTDGGSLLLMGLPTIAVGLGFLGSSAFSFRLSRSLGLIHDGQASR